MRNVSLVLVLVLATACSTAQTAPFTANFLGDHAPKRNVASANGSADKYDCLYILTQSAKGKVLGYGMWVGVNGKQDISLYYNGNAKVSANVALTTRENHNFSLDVKLVNEINSQVLASEVESGGTVSGATVHVTDPLSKWYLTVECNYHWPETE